MKNLFWKSCGIAAIAIPAAQLALLLPAGAADYDVGSIHISTPWARATPKGAATGAAYMTVTNNGTASDRLNCVSDDASAQCQIHSMIMENGVMIMRPVEGGLEIKPGETVTLAPGGFHIMLLDLKAPLEQGKTLKAKLKFDHAGPVDVEFPIAAVGAPGPGGAAGGAMNMQGGSMNMGPGGSMSMPSSGGGMQMNKQ
jgi:copper(I)-binding protein